MQANPRMEIVRRVSQAKSSQSICDLLCIRLEGYCSKACGGMARQWLKALSPLVICVALPDEILSLRLKASGSRRSPKFAALRKATARFISTYMFSE